MQHSILATMVCGCLLFMLAPSSAQTTSGRPTSLSLVPALEQISDGDARLALARLLSYGEDHLDDSIREYRTLLSASPGHFVARRELARIFMRQKKYDDAVRELNAVIKEKPDDPEAQLALGQICLWSGNYPQAIDLFKKLLRQKKTDHEALLGLARAYSWSKRHEEAWEAYVLAFLQIKNPDAELYAEFGDSYRNIGKIADAVSRYRHAVKMEPNAPGYRKKLGLALSWSGQDTEAMVVLEKSYLEQPQDREIAIELARIHVRRKAWPEAQAILEDLAVRFPDDLDVMTELADIEAARGHAQRCRDLYLQALSRIEDRRSLVLRYADRMTTWGDFYGAERIYRKELRIDPLNRDVSLKLAVLLTGMQRYEEAEGLCQELLIRFPGWEKPLLEIARLKLLEKNEESAIIYAGRFLSLKPESMEGLVVKADALAGLGRFAEAAAVYETLEKRAECRVAAKLQMGKMALIQRKDQEADRYFEEAFREAPDMPEVRFYHAGPEKAAGDAFVGEMVASSPASHALEEWARLYARAGLYAIAAVFYRKALERDPAYFPARIGLAEILAVDHQYKASLDIYRELDLTFPDASKIMIGEARVLSWSREYGKAVDLYEKIHQQNPDDPVPLREAARTAMWGKKFEQSMAIYGRLTANPVDRQLEQALSGLQSRIADRTLGAEIGTLQRRVQEGSLYQGYKAMREVLATEKGFIGGADVERRFAELLPAYRIQKTADLESRAKRLAWQKRPAQALDAYEALIAESPGNQEAIFDRAQAACSLGLCDLESDLYRRLLRIDPMHSLARLGLINKEFRTHPSLKLDHWYWKESGRGDLSRIMRNRSALGLSLPLLYRYQLQVTGLAWNEHTDHTDQTYQAEGFSLELNGVVNAHVKGGLGWTHKGYRDRDFSDRDTGFGRMGFNLWDHIQIGIGFDRSDELYNYFGLKQGVQADNWWVSAASDLTRKLNLSGQARRIVYSDQNTGQYYALAAGYAFTDHPRIFKAILSGEYRQTEKQNQLMHDAAGRLTDIIHPYWTPKDYTAGGVTLQWYHDVSKLLFCGGDLHFYDLRVSLGTDSESNASIKIEGQWHYEFYYRWLIGLQGMIHRSREWNAESLYGTLLYRF